MIHQRAAILAIGDELTLGQTVDTNSAWISDQLTAMGIVPVEHVTVPDSLEALARVLRRLSRDVELVIATGQAWHKAQRKSAGFEAEGA